MSPNSEAFIMFHVQNVAPILAALRNPDTDLGRSALAYLLDEGNLSRIAPSNLRKLAWIGIPELSIACAAALLARKAEEFHGGDTAVFAVYHPEESERASCFARFLESYEAHVGDHPHPSPSKPGWCRLLMARIAVQSSDQEIRDEAVRALLKYSGGADTIRVDQVPNLVERLSPDVARELVKARRARFPKLAAKYGV